MWGRKDEGGAGAAPAAAPAAKPEPAKPAAPVRTASSGATPVAPSRTTERKGGQALIGKSLKIKGAVSGHEDLYVDGEIEGTVELEENNLTVGPNGIVNADVKARDIKVLGKLTGNVRAGERVEITKTGSVEGDLVTSRIVIEDGAVFRGSIDIVKPDQAGARPAAAPKQPPASVSSAATANKAGD